MGIKNRERAIEAWKTNKQMRGTTAMFLIVLSDLAEDVEGQIYLSNSKLADRCGRSPRFVTRHRARLQELGLIAIVDPGGPKKVSTWQLFPDYYGVGTLGALGTQGAQVDGTTGAIGVGRQGVPQLGTTGGSHNRREPNKKPKSDASSNEKQEKSDDRYIPDIDQHIPIIVDNICTRCREPRIHEGHSQLKALAEPEAVSA